MILTQTVAVPNSTPAIHIAQSLQKKIQAKNNSAVSDCDKLVLKDGFSIYCLWLKPVAINALTQTYVVDYVGCRNEIGRAYC